MRKALNEQDIRDLIKEDDNPSQMLRRWEKLCKQAIDDLALFAKKLPNDVQAEIYTYKNLKPFAHLVLNGNDQDLHSFTKISDKSTFIGEDENLDKLHDERTLQNAASFATEGINICKDHCLAVEKEHPGTAKHTIELLEKAIEACNLMAFKHVTKRGRIRVFGKRDELPEHMRDKKIEGK
jgi:hypothetical protein